MQTSLSVAMESQYGTCKFRIGSPSQRIVKSARRLEVKGLETIVCGEKLRSPFYALSVEQIFYDYFAVFRKIFSKNLKHCLKKIVKTV